MKIDSSDQSLILDSIDSFLERDVRPHLKHFESNDEYPQEMADKMAEMGLFGATISPEYGGLGLDAETYVKIVERVAAIWMSVSGIFNSHLIMCSAVERFGTDSMKKNYLPRFASGELRGGIALTEPDCGTDLQAVRTRAEARGDHYLLNGSKMWSTNSVEGNVLAVLAKTGPEPAGTRSKNLSLFLVQKEMGYQTSKLKKLGYRGIDTGGVSFDDVKVPKDHLIGGEGKGLQQILSGLELGRINVAARGVGIARACLEESLAYAQQRK
ncbi:MAG: acyl-CoA dehydrogenase family protein, partial [SAR324 cluster bacterium]|nr:acyl-CoA dehydrogenase family protein [SAR324 cluster bacterium]